VEQIRIMEIKIEKGAILLQGAEWVGVTRGQQKAAEKGEKAILSQFACNNIGGLTGRNLYQSFHP
jgi:hypothetical protein